ncbi:MAG: hypothetical protein AB1450_10655 [Pseudomonadota bacterium]
MHTLHIPLLTLYLLLAIPPAMADDTGPFGTAEQSATAPGLIMPLEISGKDIAPHDQKHAAALTQKLQALHALAARTPLLRQPRGFSVEPVLYTAGGTQAPLAGALSLYFRPVYLHWESTRRDPQTGRYFTPHPNDGITFMVNQPARLLGEELGRDAQGAFHTAPELVERGNGWLEHRSHKYHLLVHIGNGRKPYRPISSERYLNHLIAEARVLATEAETNDSGDSVPTQEELLAELRQTERDLLASGMERAQVDAMLAPMRETLAAYQPVVINQGELAALAAEAHAVTQDHVQALERELAALSPAQRKAPACQYLGEPKYMPASGMDIHCRDPRGLIVEANPEFFDPRQPRDAVQLLVIHYFPRRGDNGKFTYLDVAHNVMDALRQEDILATLQ